MCALLAAAPSAHAVISCTLTINSVSIFYNPAGADVSTAAMYTINCTRSTTGEGPTVSYSLTSDYGLQPSGQNRQAILAGSTYKYELFKNAGFGPNDQWGTPNPASRAITGSITFGTGSLFATSGGAYYYLFVAAGQPVGPAGVYTDTVIATLSYSSADGSGAPTAPFSVSITSITNCTVTAPTSLAFAYTSFQATAATPNANFTVNCTTGTPKRKGE